MNSDAHNAGAGGEGHGTASHLIKMANDIGNFFRAEPVREDAIAGIANHISKYWTRRMREKIAAQVKLGDADLDDLPREALGRLMAQQAAAPQTPAPPPLTPQPASR
jgi:formate dehydrogenase subunit delta